MRWTEIRPSNAWLERSGLLFGLIVYGALQLYSLGLYEGDENIYLYLADRAAAGALPYRDFFHAHPPFHLLPGALLFRALGGFESLAGHAIPMLAAVATAFLLHRAGRTRGMPMGALSSLLYLFSFHVLLFSGHFLGASLCAMWVALGLERAARGGFAAAGMAFAAATFTLLNAAPAALGVGIVLLWQTREGALRFAIGGLATFVLLNALAAMVFGWAFFDQVYLYHLGKGVQTGYSLAVFRSVAYADPWLAYGALAGAATLLLRPVTSPDESVAQTPVKDGGALLLPICLGAALASLVFLIAVPRLFAHYFLVLFCCLAPLAASGIVEIARRAHGALRQRRLDHGVEALILLGIACAGLLPFGFGLTHDTLPTGRYAFAPSGVSIVDSVVRKLFWRDEKAPQTHYGGVTRYLWSASRSFASAHEIAALIERESREDDTLFGDSTSAPLIALLAGRRIALDEADTNAMRFGRSEGSVAELITRLDADPPKFVIGRWGYEILSFDEIQTWLDDRFVRIGRIDEPSVRDQYGIWRRDDDAKHPGSGAGGRRD